ncbi:MAG: DUF5110 domain-containing protein, partial [Culicoidibacterales bacterium]
QLTLKIYPGVGMYCHYEDDGESFAYETGEYNETKFTLTETAMQVTRLHQGYASSYISYQIILIGVRAATVEVDGQAQVVTQMPEGVRLEVESTIMKMNW